MWGHAAHVSREREGVHMQTYSRPQVEATIRLRLGRLLRRAGVLGLFLWR